VPGAVDGTSAKIYVTGTTAGVVDYLGFFDTWLPIVLLVVLSLSFVLLLVAFRSIVIPAQAIAMNLLSVGASYGLLVLVFQKGVGAGLTGLTQVESIEAWVPLMLFALLFGLSMDYQVFLLSRIKERYDQTGNTREAVGYGLGRTGSIITGAAAIMVCVFGGMATGELVVFQQMGFGLAVAILIDATVVRTIIVPASMELLGDWNWYLPRWLEWLPNVAVEGHAPTTYLPGAVPTPAFQPQLQPAYRRENGRTTVVE
jgi:RND superfamily putative drug exporter